MTNWYDKQPEDDTDYTDEAERDAHYRHIVRAGIKVCLCGHVHPATLEGEKIFHVYDDCWMSCGCTKYRESRYLAKQFRSDELNRDYRTPKMQPVVLLRPDKAQLLREECTACGGDGCRKCDMWAL